MVTVAKVAVGEELYGDANMTTIRFRYVRHCRAILTRVFNKSIKIQ